MIPTMILLGLILGLIPLGWGRRATVTAVVAVLGPLAFGLAVGELLDGTFLALTNVAVGSPCWPRHPEGRSIRSAPRLSQVVGYATAKLTPKIVVPVPSNTRCR